MPPRKQDMPQNLPELHNRRGQAKGVGAAAGDGVISLSAMMGPPRSYHRAVACFQLFVVQVNFRCFEEEAQERMDGRRQGWGGEGCALGVSNI